ncbi:hypothetical protein [Caballeronia sp. DA-9]|uniref:hypothetical protein n=1 Tax=Caballeronia sp. DA-9 TaxID=3436237 RepID=UPI003F668027
MTRKHTLGPWMTLPDEANKPYVRIRGSVAGSRFKIANVLKPIYDDAPEWEEEETRANVRLIEAAPDLLEALMLTVRYLDEPAGCTAEIIRDREKFEALLNRAKNSQNEAITKARAAITKATGA